MPCLLIGRLLCSVVVLEAAGRALLLWSGVRVLYLADRSQGRQHRAWSEKGVNPFSGS